MTDVPPINRASLFYPHLKNEEAKAPATAAPPNAPPAPSPAAASSSTPAPHSEPEKLGQAARLYGDLPPTRDLVRWDETPAAAAEIKFDPAPGDHGADAPEVEAARTTLAEAMAHAGAGASIARELYRDAAAASRPDYKPVTAEQGMVTLREAWGPAFDRNLEAARGAILKAAEKDPGIISYLEQTGLGNDPAFIRKIAARATRRN